MAGGRRRHRHADLDGDRPVRGDRGHPPVRHRGLRRHRPSWAAQTESAQATGSITLPAASLPAAFDNVDITDDSNTTIGNLDGAGSNFSAQALGADGAAPGPR
jgi:hypothetical protein